MEIHENGQTTYRKQLRRFDEPHEARFLTFSCFKRRPFLSRDRSRRWFIEALERARKIHGIDVWAFVIMPEHVHLLVYPRQRVVKMADFLYSLKKSVTNRSLEFVRREAPAFLRRMEDTQPNGKRAFRFWQRGGGYDENLFNPKKIWEKIRYIHMNPVRRDLCEQPEDWPWSSASAYENHSAHPIRIDFDSLPEPT